MVDIYCVSECVYLVKKLSKSFFVEKNNISSLLVIDDDMECKDLIVMIIEDFGIQNRHVSLNKRFMFTAKTMVEDFSFVSLEKDRQLRTFINIYKVV